MIKGMTGFGSAQISTGKMKVVAEAKSVNHRYFDMSYYLPPGLGALENKIRQMIQKGIERGKVTVSVKIIQKFDRKVALNKEAVGRYLKYARSMVKEYHLKDDLCLSNLISLPGIFETQESSLDAETVWPVLEKCLKRALAGLEGMRKREGRSLAADVSDQLRRMSLQIKKIQSKSKDILVEQIKRLPAEEYKSFEKSCDINEEISRLSHYIDEMKALLKSNAAIGKKVDFIAQEMQRETNTIGSKLQDKVVSNAVIALKSKIEKIREQAQNVE